MARMAGGLEATLLERLGRVLGEDERVVAKEVVHVDPLRREELVVLAVADRQLEVLVRDGVDDERALLRLQRAEGLNEGLRLDLGQLERADLFAFHVVDVDGCHSAYPLTT